MLSNLISLWHFTALTRCTDLAGHLHKDYKQLAIAVSGGYKFHFYDECETVEIRLDFPKHVRLIE